MKKFYLIKGHAGSGKSVIGKRIAWDSAIEFDKICIYTKESANLDYDILYELQKSYR